MLTEADLQLLYRFLTTKLNEYTPQQDAFSVFTEARRLIEGELRNRFGAGSVPE